MPRDQERPLLKAYLGDGAYMEFRGDRIILTAEDGIRATDTVVLEPEVLHVMQVYLKQWGLI